MLHRHHYRGIPFHLNTIYYYYNTSSSSILMMMCSKSPSPSSSLLNHPPPPPATANNKYNNKIKFKSYNGFIIKPSNPHLSLLKLPPFFSISNNNVTSFSTYANIPSPVSEAYLEKSDDEIVDTPQPQLERLKVKLEEVGIRCKSYKTGQINGLLCPMAGGPSAIILIELGSRLSTYVECKGGDTGEKKLSLFIAEDCNAAMWNCFRAKCGWRGSTRGTADVRSSYNKMNKLPSMKKARNITESELNLEPLCNDLCEYFAERMISEETLRRNSVMQRRYDDQIVIAFTYRRKGELVSCKYRDLAKKFWQESDTEKVLYGLDDIEGTSDVIIVEGEMDKLAMEEAGFRNCVSVPDGAPPTVSSKDVPSVEQDKKYQYLWNCKDYLEKASRIILATDADEPGQALAEEIARRLGRERCWRVTWPSKNDNEQFKDANEVLMFMGPAVLREAVESAELYPIKGLFCFRDYFSEIDAYYHQTLGAEIGVSTGWRAMDDLYNVVPGELTIVTGVPNSGKSEWIDALLCNLNKSVGWKFALCSMENKVREHARKLLEKHVKKPFFNVRYGKSIERMSVEELEEGKQWLNDTFHLIRCENDCLPSTNWVLSLAKAAVLRHGVNGLVIDPYNELDHQRPPNQTETEYVSQMLTSIKRFAQHHSCHVWFVAHPKQLQQWTGKPPNLYDISGSAHFINKCDNGIVVHRNRDPDEGAMDQVQICVRKVRNKVSGTIGDAYLSYNRITGEYMDIK